MIVEYIRYALTTHSGYELWDAYRLAAEQLTASKNAHARELTRRSGDSAQSSLRIDWDGAEGTLQGYTFPFVLEGDPTVHWRDPRNAASWIDRRGITTMTGGCDVECQV